MKKVFYISENDDGEKNGNLIEITSNKFQKYSTEKETLHQIDRLSLIPDQEINFSLYIRKDFSFAPVLEASESKPSRITPAILNIHTDFLITKKDIPLYKEYLESLQNKILFSNDEKTKAKGFRIV